jgi:hypothetical protein
VRGCRIDAIPPARLLFNIMKSPGAMLLAGLSTAVANAVSPIAL